MIKKLFSQKSYIYSFLSLFVPVVTLLSTKAVSITWIFILALLIIVTMVLLPVYCRQILKVEDKFNLKTANLSISRLLRLFLHIPWVLVTFLTLSQPVGIQTVQHFILLSLVGASAGLHSVGICLAYRGVGERAGNAIISMMLSAWVVCLVTVNSAFLMVPIFLCFVYILHLANGFITDFKAYFYPQSGIGVFFGTFNPVHKTHLAILKNAIESRGLTKIYVHPTTIPKLHKEALYKGELSVEFISGMLIYSKTDKADHAKNYFPTGDRFYDYKLRQELLNASILDEGLQGKVEILSLPDIYDKKGFFGILEHIKNNNPNTKIHGLHGSDIGGIWVRHIFDLSGGIYPYPIKRVDNISATAIRSGATGYTTNTVERFLGASRANQDFVFPSGYVFKASNNII